MIFKLYDCDCGVKINGVSYDFEHVENVSSEDPRFTKLTRGANAKNKTGIAFTEGIKEPDRVSFTVIGLDAPLKAVLDSVHALKTRVEVYAVNRLDGSSKIWRQAVLSQKPQQLMIDESPDSMNVVLAFESFDMEEKHKS